jgi:hypothetical protein
MAIKYIHIPTSSIARPSQIYPNWIFGLKIHVASGNPGSNLYLEERRDLWLVEMRRDKSKNKIHFFQTSRQLKNSFEMQNFFFETHDEK